MGDNGAAGAPGGIGRCGPRHFYKAIMTRIPVTLVTGLLGSGKTTLLNHLLRQDAYCDTLVVIHELGEAALDHMLMAHASEASATAGPAGGCACCVVRQDMAKILLDAPWRFSRGGKRLYSRVLVETSGLADPVAVAQVLGANKRLAELYRLDHIVAVVDAQGAYVSGVVTPGVATPGVVTPAVSASAVAAQAQIVQADRLVLNKNDISDVRTLASLQAHLRALNPGARQFVAAQGEVDPAIWFDEQECE